MDSEHHHPYNNTGKTNNEHVERKDNKMEIIKDEMLEEIVGGTTADLEAFKALAIEKGYSSTNNSAGARDRAKLYRAVGMSSVRWNANTDKRAEFIDNAGGIHSFDEIYELMKALPHK